MSEPPLPSSKFVTPNCPHGHAYGTCLMCYHDLVAEQQSGIEVLRAELAQSRQRIDFFVGLLARFWNFSPPDLKAPDGRTFQFVDPNPHRTLQFIKEAMDLALKQTEVAAASAHETTLQANTQALTEFVQDVIAQYDLSGKPVRLEIRSDTIELMRSALKRAGLSEKASVDFLPCPKGTCCRAAGHNGECEPIYAENGSSNAG